MSDSPKDELEVDSPLEISDEEFNEMSLEDIEALVTSDDNKDDSTDADNDEEDKETSEAEDDEKEKSESDAEDDDDDAEDSSLAADSEDDSEDTDDSKEESDELDYKAQFEDIMAPFKANNREIQVDSVEDARRLMQMGANYNKKMAGLKPNLKLMKMLENNDLLDEEKLSFLIDLDKKNPEAVTKLLKDSGLDPDDIDLEADNGYKANSTYTVDDKEVELDGILGEIQDTESFDRTIDIIGNKWDEASRKLVLDQPEAIKHINEHIETGIYDRIMTVVEQERMVGRLTGMSDLEAYKHVGDAIHASGGFDTPTGNPADNVDTSTRQTKKVPDPKLKSKKKAASSTKGSTVASKKDDFNPLSMSDEEFAKIDSKYI
jgi:hypothetical protein